MKKKLFYLLALLPVLTLFAACGGDDGDEDVAGPVIVKEDGTTSDGSTFSAIDDKNFYLDYIKYSVEEGHLVVSGYNNAGIKGAAKIVSGITYKGNTYEVRSISRNAFKDCTNMASITIPESVTSIGDGAFYGCICLMSVTIPNFVNSIGDDTFSGCKGLTSVTIGNSVSSIGDGAFSGCTDLTGIIIPNSVTSIGGDAFRGCTSMTSIKVDAENTKYDSRNNCNAIIETASNTLIIGCENTTIPNSVANIRAYAFYGCTGLTSVNIPNSVTIIGQSAFSYCSGLMSVTICNSVTSIGVWAFDGCTSLSEVTCKAKTPPSMYFSNINPDTKLYVPIGSGSAYKSSKWGEYFKQENIIEKEM